MKKIALFCAVAGVALSVMAGSDGLKFKFSSSGDTYADGSAVQNGEVYALVWVDDGAEFKGFNTDGSLVDPEKNSLAAVSFAQGGGCIKTVFVVDDKAGTYSLYLLDTRVTVVENGTVTKKATGLDDNGKFTVVNDAVEINDAEIRSLVASESSTVNGATATVVASVVDESKVEQPVVSGFTLTAGGGVVLTVSGTVPYVQYNVYGGTAPNAIGDKPLATFLNGKVSGDLEFKVSDVEGNKFFKVATK